MRTITEGPPNIQTLSFAFATPKQGLKKKQPINPLLLAVPKQVVLVQRVLLLLSTILSKSVIAACTATISQSRRNCNCRSRPYTSFLKISSHQQVGEGKMASEGKMVCQGSERKMKNKSKQKLKNKKLIEEVLSILKEPKAPVPLFGEDVLKALDQLVAAKDQLQHVVGKDQLQLVAEKDQLVVEMDQLVVEKNQLKAGLQKLKDDFEAEKKELTTTMSMVMDAANQEFKINEELRKEIRRLRGSRR